MDLDLETLREMVDSLGGPREAQRLVNIYIKDSLAGEFDDAIAHGQQERTEVALLYWLADLRSRNTPGPSHQDWIEAQRRANAESQ